MADIPPVSKIGTALAEALKSPQLPLSISDLIRKYSFDVRSRFYKNETIYLDGYSFTNCGFKDCVLVTNTGVFTLEGCTVMNCRVYFGDNAMKIIKLFYAFGGAPNMPVFWPEVAPDGAITIR